MEGVSRRQSVLKKKIGFLHQFSGTRLQTHSPLAMSGPLGTSFIFLLACVCDDVAHVRLSYLCTVDGADRRPTSWA